MLDEFHSQDVVIKRLKRMKATVDQKERKNQKDPFKKTFLEKIREICGVDNHQHSIRARLHWFASSDWRRLELEQEIDKNVKLSSMQTIINENRGINYGVDTLDPNSMGYDPAEFNDEYLQMVREAEAKNNASNDLDFSVSGSYPVTEKGSPEPGTSDSDKPTKTTSELFLSVSNYVCENKDTAAAETLVAANLVSQGED